MAFKDKIGEIFNRIAKNKMQKKLDIVKDKFDESETKEEGVEEATNIVISEIQKNPNMPIIEFLKMIQEEENLPTEIVIEAIKQMSKMNTEDSTVKDAVEELDLPSRGIQDIIKEVDSLDTAKTMANQIPDKQIKEQEKNRLAKIERERREIQKKKKEEQIKKNLKDKYINCDKIHMTNLVSDVKEVWDKNSNQDIHNIITQILARKAAIECLRYGTTRISTITKIIPPEQMLEEDFLKRVREEFEDVKEKKEYQGEKDHQYSEKELRMRILSKIAKNVAKTYQEVGIIDIPQTESMKKVTEEEEQYLIDKIQIYEKEINNIEKIKNQIRGNKNYEVEDLIEMVTRIPEKERTDYINSFQMQIKRGNKKEIIFSEEINKKLEEMKDKLHQLNEDDRVQVIEETIENIEERIKPQNQPIKEDNESIR